MAQNQPCQSAKTVSVVPGRVVDEPEHGEGHGDEADGEVGDGQVDDEQVASGARLRVSNHHPADAQVCDHAHDHQETGKRLQLPANATSLGLK